MNLINFRVALLLWSMDWMLLIGQHWPHFKKNKSTTNCKCNWSGVRTEMATTETFWTACGRHRDWRISRSIEQ